MKVNRKQLGLAMLLSIVVMLLSAIVVKAAPAPPLAAGMSLPMAIVVGVMYYLALSPWFANLGFTVLYRPLFAGMLVGLVMGQPAEGTAIGANINVLYLGWIAAGGALPGDIGVAGYLGTALVLGGGLDTTAALALAAPLGILGGMTWNVRMSLCSIIPHWADRFAEEGNIKAVARSNYIYSQPFLLVLYAVPVALAAYLGAPAVAAALQWITTNANWVLTGLRVTGGMLAALGIALNLKFLLRGNVWPYFFLGFVIASLMGAVNLLVMAIIAACVGLLHVWFTEGAPAQQAAAPAEARVAPGLLTKRDVFRAWLRWLFFSHACYNWQRMQGLGFAQSMAPIIEKLYKSKEDVIAALKRHLVFFNTEPDFGSVIHGAVIAMEEERAAGAPISDEAINSVKTGLMGPMAGVGDTIDQGIAIPLLLAIGIGIAVGPAPAQTAAGNILGPLFHLVAMAAYIWGLGWTLWWQGYSQGRQAITNLLRGGLLNRVMVFAGVLGNFVMGVLAVRFVRLATPVAFMVGGAKFELQPVLNMLMPNLLPLLLVLFVWWLVARKQISPTRIMVAMIVIGVVASYPIWPGLDAKTGAPLLVGLFS